MSKAEETTTKSGGENEPQNKDDKSDDESEGGNAIVNCLFKWVFPIYMDEILQILPLIFMMFSSLFSYTAYRDIKDAIVFDEERQTLHTVQWCKVMVFFISIPVVALYLKLANVVSKQIIFYQTVFWFACYFIINATLLYPGRAVIHSGGVNVIRSIAESNSQAWSTRLLPLVGLFVFPINTLHYVVAELWGTISVSFLLWGYINEITPKEKAKRYYGTLGLGAQLGPYLGGEVVSALKNSYGKGRSQFLKLNIVLNYISLGFMALFTGSYAFMHAYVMKLDRYKQQLTKASGGSSKKKGKPKMAVSAAFKYCLTNPYVLALGGMVFAYGWVMVISELSYKDLMKLETEGDQNSYSKFKGDESKFSAIGAALMMIFVSHNIIRIFGWKVTALLAPVACTVLASVFYMMALTMKLYDPDVEAPDKRAMDDKTDSTIKVVYAGLILCIMVKAIKYASFDPAKELAYLPLTKEQKYKAKAAVDIVGARMGKGGAALVLNIIVLNWCVGAEVTYITPCLIVSAIAVIAGLCIWMCSDLYIAKEMNKKEQENAQNSGKIKKLSDVKVDGTQTNGQTNNVELSKSKHSVSKPQDTTTGE